MSEVIQAQEIANKLRCPRCKRQTNPNTDYINVKTGKQCMNCERCRAMILNNVNKCYDPEKAKKRQRDLYQLKRKPTLREKCDIYEKLIKLLPAELVKETCEQNDIQISPDLFDGQIE